MTAPGALAGLKVVELTTLIAGPIVGRILGELGANVIHIEPPWGDDGRRLTTPFLGSEGLANSIHNRSKRGISLDIKQEAGREVLHRLLADADVFVENMTLRALDRLGLGYADLHARYPRLVYVSITGWGRTGPRAAAPGYDVILQAYVGAAGRPAPDLPPMFAPFLIADPVAPLLALTGALTALYRRSLTGEGSHVTTSLLQAALHLKVMRDGIIAESAPPETPAAMGGSGGNFAALMETADEQLIVLCAISEDHYRRLCEVTGFDLGLEPEYGTRAGREAHHDEIQAVFAGWVSSKPRDEAIALLTAAGVPSSPVNSLEDLMTDPQVVANGMVVTLDHPTKGRLREFAPPLEIDGVRGRVTPAPLFGQHTDEILGEHGYDSAAIAALRASQVVM